MRRAGSQGSRSTGGWRCVLCEAAGCRAVWYRVVPHERGDRGGSLRSTAAAGSEDEQEHL